MANKIEFGGSGLGDVDLILHHQGVSDLSWLSVDEEAYRAAETLPKQNLDIIEDLQHALTYSDDELIPHVVPMKPHTFVTENVIPTSYANLSAPIAARTASYVMAGLNKSEIASKLALEFPKEELRLASESIKNIYSERGLLGKVYVDPSHLERCHNLTKNDLRVATSFKTAKFVIAGKKCGTCVCNNQGSCTSLKKTIASEVPYGPKLAASLFPVIQNGPRLAALNEINSDWKTRIQNAFLAKEGPSNPDGIKTAHTQHKVEVRKASNEELMEALRPKVAGEVFVPSRDFIKYQTRMLDGKDDREVLRSSGDASLKRLAGEYGLLGNTYIDIDWLGGCHVAAKYLSIPTLKYAIRRSPSCTNCFCSSNGNCSKIASTVPILESHPVYPKEWYLETVKRASAKGGFNASVATRLSTSVPEISDYKSLVQSIADLKVAASDKAYSGTVQKYASSEVKQVKHISPEEIIRTVGDLQNHGIHGKALVAALTSRYERSDLKQHSELGKRFASSDGIQGHYYVDPSVYLDYGRGCDEGAKKFRKVGAKHVMACSKCSGCRLQTAPGWCSKYAKTLIASVPQDVVEAHKASKSLPIIQQAPPENPVEKYEMDQGMELDLSGSKDRSIDMTMSMPSLGD
jgi:hypothetical protein